MPNPLAAALAGAPLPPLPPEQAKLAREMTHQGTPFDPLSQYTRAPQDVMVDMILGGDSRVAKHATNMGEFGNQVYDPPIEPAFMGMDAGAAFAAPRLARGAGRAMVGDMSRMPMNKQSGVVNERRIKSQPVSRDRRKSDAITPFPVNRSMGDLAAKMRSALEAGDSNAIIKLKSEYEQLFK